MTVRNLPVRRHTSATKQSRSRHERGVALLELLSSGPNVELTFPAEAILALVTHPRPPERLVDLQHAIRQSAETTNDQELEAGLQRVLCAAAKVSHLKDFASVAVASMAYL